ncbi:MAG: complex I NDUFA9 subunit family protein [Rhodocyclaceae bacterium]|nr:complex I NDUFA9 subunit family protein [Rhodocyclaceae bacterium]MBK7814611.1 complex I NDUFA9 subunit family protein [Rhodocyclaceae bacterium]
MASVLVVGGSGFVGSHLVRRLAGRGLRVVVPTRRRERAKPLTLLPTVEVVEADVHDEATLRRLCADQDAVVNLVGILKGGNGDPYGPGFARAHVELPRRVAEAARQAGIDRFMHMSALKADAAAPSGYLRSKAAGEAAVRSALPSATIFRPSVIFGAGDSFLSMFAGLMKFAPVMPLAAADALFQPVWIGNVADAFVEALLRPESEARTYELCGPTVYALRGLVACAGEYSGRRRPVIGLSPGLSWLQALALELVGGPMTRDNLRSMSVPNVCADGCALPFGLAPAALEQIAPGYLGALGRPSR